MKKIIFTILISLPIIAFPQANKGNPIDEWNAGKPLPNLPNLSKPVYLKKGAYICSTPAQLVNPSETAIKMALHTGVCAITKSRKRVMVHPPRNAQDYSNAYYGGYIQISWKSSNMSDGTINSVWTAPEYLKN